MTKNIFIIFIFITQLNAIELEVFKDSNLSKVSYIEYPNNLMERLNECLTIQNKLFSIYITRDNSFKFSYRKKEIDILNSKVLKCEKNFIFYLKLLEKNNSLISKKYLKLLAKKIDRLISYNSWHGMYIKNIYADSLFIGHMANSIVSANKLEYENKHDGKGDIVNGNKIVNENKYIPFEKEVEKKLENLKLGKYIFNFPKSMSLYDIKETTLRISENEIFINDLNLSNKTLKEDINISSFMKAKLISSDFKILDLNSEEQIIKGKGFTEWKWLISPIIKKSKGIIYLRITLRFPFSNGSEEKLDIPTIKREIKIKVNF